MNEKSPANGRSKRITDHLSSHEGISIRDKKAHNLNALKGQPTVDSACDFEYKESKHESSAATDLRLNFRGKGVQNKDYGEKNSYR